MGTVWAITTSPNTTASFEENTSSLTTTRRSEGSNVNGNYFHEIIVSRSGTIASAELNPMKKMKKTKKTRGHLQIRLHSPRRSAATSRKRSAQGLRPRTPSRTAPGSCTHERTARGSLPRPSHTTQRPTRTTSRTMSATTYLVHIFAF